MSTMKLTLFGGNLLSLCYDLSWLCVRWFRFLFFIFKHDKTMLSYYISVFCVVIVFKCLTVFIFPFSKKPFRTYSFARHNFTPTYIKVSMSVTRIHTYVLKNQLNTFCIFYIFKHLYIITA